jgi:hypothetical protein
MLMRTDMMPWVLKGLADNGDKSHFIEVAKHIWANHRSEIESSGDFLYRWQYEMRCAADKLAHEPVKYGHTGIWELN